jgi:hypothetical protein
MGEDGEWSIEYYVAENGKSPGREFLLGLDKKLKQDSLSRLSG